MPRYAYDQEELCKILCTAMQLDKSLERWFQKVSRHSAIKRRYSVLPNFSEEVPSMSERTALYKREAPNLAQEAAEKALSGWGGERESITHLISITCTGVITPGIETILIDRLNLKRSVERFGINMMGCFGAFKGLAAAQALIAENPEHRVLVVCTELCSLHFLPSQERERLIGNALFADGAAAVVIGTGEGEWEIVRRASFMMENSREMMTWDAGDHAFEMFMGRDVPRSIENSIQGFTTQLFEGAECEWALHPGGKAIIEAIQNACGIGKEQTDASWEVLKNYGNMSSPTFLFVLEHLKKKPAKHPLTLGIGFGPGLSVEGIVLKRTIP